MPKQLTDRLPRWLLLLVLITVPVMAKSAESDPGSVELIMATDMALDSQKARHDGRVILLLVSQEECPYCTLMKQDILGPMIKSGDYTETLLIRELMIDQGTEILDFQGNTQSGSDFAHGYGVGMTPVLLFLDADGRELTSRMIGIQTPEMFYYYVDQSVQAAITTLNQSARL